MTLAITSLFMFFVLLGVAALAVDYGMLYTARTSAQHAADAGALAGAFVFVQPGVTDFVTAATGEAKAVATKSSILGVAVTASEVAVNVDTANQRVKVTIGPHTVPTFFARVLNMNSADVTTIATAEAAKGAAGGHCVKPIFIPNTVLATDANVTAACSAGHKLFNNNALTTWAKGVIGTQTSAVTIRPTTANSGPSPSQYYSIDFGAGGSTYGCSISHCATDPSCNASVSAVQCGNPYSTQNGTDIGNTISGLQDLMAIAPNDQYSPGTGITSSGGTPKETSPQLAVVPVWDDCAPGGGITPGRQTFPVVGFAQVFIQTVQTNNGGSGTRGAIGGWVVGADACGSSGGGNTGGSGGTGPYSIPIRLVQDQ